MTPWRSITSSVSTKMMTVIEFAGFAGASLSR